VQYKPHHISRPISSVIEQPAAVTNGLITSAIKLAIKLTIKLKSYCSYNKQHFVVATTKMLMRDATVVQARALSTVTTYGTYGRDAELLPGEWVSWPASSPEPAPITMLSRGFRGILGGDGDRPELAAVHNCCSPH